MPLRGLSLHLKGKEYNEENEAAVNAVRMLQLPRGHPCACRKPKPERNDDTSFPANVCSEEVNKGEIGAFLAQWRRVFRNVMFLADSSAVKRVSRRATANRRKPPTTIGEEP
jgi:hypothetical protein